MTIDSLDALLEKLNSGDDHAAEQVFAEYEPYLRKVVRRLLPRELRAKFDSIDVVQSMYCDVLVAFREGGRRFANAQQLRAFLTKATRNRFIDRVRTNQTAARREQPLGGAERLPSSAQPRPGDIAMAEELWDRLLALSPPEHHPLLLLRRQGATASEIGKQLNLHEGSVRRILRELAVRLACGKATDLEARTR